MSESKIDLKAVRDYFGMSVADMKREWVPLSPEEKRQINDGIVNGTLTY